MQTRFHRGSYEFDTVLSRIANELAPDDLVGQDIQNNERPIVEPDETYSIMRQREILEYFSQMLEN